MSAEHIEIDIVDGVAQVTLGRHMEQLNGAEPADNGSVAESPTTEAEIPGAIASSNGDASRDERRKPRHASGCRTHDWSCSPANTRVHDSVFYGKLYTYVWRPTAESLEVFDKGFEGMTMRCPRRWKADVIIDILEGVA